MKELASHQSARWSRSEISPPFFKTRSPFPLGLRFSPAARFPGPDCFWFPHGVPFPPPFSEPLPPRHPAGPSAGGLPVAQIGSSLFSGRPFSSPPGS